MVMVDSGKGSSKARVGVFFLSAGFALTAMFENICVSLGALSRKPLFRLILRRVMPWLAVLISRGSSPGILTSEGYAISIITNDSTLTHQS
jgi:hypothetical protein